MAKVIKKIPTVTTIVQHLKKDPLLAQIVTEDIHYNPYSQSNDIYNDLFDAIINQQLSVKAAATINKRVRDLFPDAYPHPHNVLEMTDEVLRSAGLSYQKIKYVKSLATAISEKTLLIDSLPERDDESVIDELIKIKGIGRWTAEMILIFSLNRQDIFSLGDLGLRNAIAKLYNIDRDDLETIRKISDNWSPYRSFASKFLWKSLDNLPKYEN